MKKVAIIGGGAAGLLSAVFLARAGVKIDIFEGNNKLGKKILVSGNGHCNISNTRLNYHNYICEHQQFIENILKSFTFNNLKEFLLSLGLLTFSKDDGRTYPLSYEAKSVVFAFENILSSLNVKIHYNHHVTNIQKNGSFSLTCKDIIYKNYSDVIISSGTQAMPRLGGNDDGFNIAKSFGHTVVPTYPALVALNLKSSFCEKLNGVKTDAEVMLFIDNQKKQTIIGNILFTKYGISGLAILDISLFASYAILNNQKVELSINLLPSYDRQKLGLTLSNLCKNIHGVSILSILCGLVAYKVAFTILYILKINPEILAKTINKKSINMIVNLIINWRFEVIGTRGFEYAEVSGGGISLKEIDNQTLQSKKCKNLYFAGEILDVVGKRGGYNFHFAFACGYLVAQGIINNLSK